MKILVVLLILFACSCRSIKYVEVPSIKTEKEYIDRWHRDSVYIKDSVMVMVKGDTIVKDRWRVVWKEKLIKDTIYVSNTDTLYKVIETERELTKWQRTKMSLGETMIIFIIIAVIVAGFKIYKKII